MSLANSVLESAPSLFDGTANSITVAVLLLEFGMLRGSLFRAQVRLYAAQSVAVSLLAGVVAFGRGIAELHIRSDVLPATALSLSVAVVLVSFVLMILRRDDISQAIGFFSLENGISMAGLVVAAGMPLILEVAFIFDLLVAVIVFGVIIRVQANRTHSYSTVDFDQLRG